VYFNCQEREKKEKTQTIDYLRQSNHDISTRAASCGRGRIYLDGEWPDLATGRRRTCLLNGTGVVHSLWRVEHALAVF